MSTVSPEIRKAAIITVAIMLLLILTLWLTVPSVRAQDVNQCTLYLPITIEENNNTNLVSKLFNLSIDMSAPEFFENQTIMSDENQNAVPYNITNGNTANAQLYFIGNVSASATVEYRLYYQGASCTQSQVSPSGHDSKYNVGNDNKTMLYLDFNDKNLFNRANDSFVRYSSATPATIYKDGFYETLGQGASNLTVNPPIICGDSANLTGNLSQLNNPYSVEFYFKPLATWNESVGQNRMFGLANSIATLDFLISYDDQQQGALTVLHNGASLVVGGVTRNFTQHQWYHLLVNVDDSNVARIYIDGVLENATQLDGAFTANPNTVFVGNKRDACYGGGDISTPTYAVFDEIALYNYFLPVEQSLTIPNAPNVTAGAATTNTNSTITIGYEQDVLSLETTTFSANYSFTNGTLTGVFANLIYNSTNISVPLIFNGTSEKRFSIDLTVPQVSNTQNKTFNFTFTEVLDTGSRSVVTSDTFEQRINAIQIFSCAVQNSSQEFIGHFYTTTEPNLTSVSANIEGQFNIFLQNRSEFIPVNINTNTTSFSLCASPLGENWSVDAEIFYESNGFNNRQHYLRNASLNNTDQLNKSLFLLGAERASITDFEIVDQNGEPLQVHYLEIDRKNFEDNSYDTVAIGKTDSDGLVAIYLEHDNAFYRFRIYDYNELLFTSEDTQVKSGEVKVNVLGLTFGDQQEIIGSITYSLQYDNDTKSFSLVYNDQQDEITRGCLRVTKFSLGNEVLDSDQCVNDNSGSISQVLSDNVSRYQASFYITIDGYDQFISSLEIDLTSPLSDQLGTEGILITLILVLIIAFLGTFSPVAAVAFGTLGLIIAFSFGIINLSVIGLVGIISIALIFIYKMVK